MAFSNSGPRTKTWTSRATSYTHRCGKRERAEQRRYGKEAYEWGKRSSYLTVTSSPMGAKLVHVAAGPTTANIVSTCSSRCRWGKMRVSQSINRSFQEGECSSDQREEERYFMHHIQLFIHLSIYQPTYIHIYTYFVILIQVSDSLSRLSQALVDRIHQSSHSTNISDFDILSSFRGRANGVETWV